MDHTTPKIAHLEEQLKNTRRLMYNAGKQRNAPAMGRLLKIEEEIIREIKKLMAQ